MTEVWELLIEAASELSRLTWGNEKESEQKLINDLAVAAERLRTEKKPASYGVYFFAGNGQVVPATRSMYNPIALGIASMTDAVAMRDSYRALFPTKQWIACDERFQNVSYGFHTASLDELRDHWERTNGAA